MIFQIQQQCILFSESVPRMTDPRGHFVRRCKFIFQIDPTDWQRQPTEAA